jgi:hypothetical protein
MGMPAQHDKLTKIFIERYQDALVFIGTLKDNFVAGILGPVARPHYVMASGFQFGLGLWGQAGIEKELQEPASMEKGSMRSLAAILRA